MRLKKTVYLFNRNCVQYVNACFTCFNITF